MIEALQLDLNTTYQAGELMPGKDVIFEQENLRLLQENIVLQQENVRLLQEVSDMKREHAHMERQLTRASYRIYHLRAQLHSKVSFGQVLMVIGSLAAMCLLLFYGAGSIDYSMPQAVDNDTPVVERHR